MDYVKPLTSMLSETYNDILYEKKYYNLPTGLIGVTDENHPDWNNTTTYTEGEYVLVPALKTIYRSANINNLGKYPPANPQDWQDYGVVNSYAAFATDENIGSATTGTEVVMEFDFSTSDTIVGIGLNFISANILLFDDSSINYLRDYNPSQNYPIDDAVVFNNKLYSSKVATNTGNQPDTSPTEWEERIDLIYHDELIFGKDIGVLDFATYYYTSATSVNRIIATDLEWLPSSTLRIKFNGAASVETICYGKKRNLGMTLMGTKLRYESSSKFKINEFTGYRSILRKGTVRILDVNIIFDTDMFNEISLQANEIIDENIIWIPTEDDKFSEFITLGYIENFDIPINNPSKNKTNSRIIGVGK